MYRTVDCKFWIDPKVRALDSGGKLLFLYFITNPHSHFSGFYYLPRSIVCFETGLSDTVYDTLCHTLSDTHLVFFDHYSDTIFVPKMLGYQAPGKKNLSSAVSHAEDLNHSKLYPFVVDTFKNISEGKNTLPDTLPDTVSEGYSDRIRIRKRIREEEEDKETVAFRSRKKRDSFSYSEDFEIFWTDYPRRNGATKGSKKKAHDAWGKLTEEDRASALKALYKWAACIEWTKDGGRYIPDAERYLGHRLFDDPPPVGRLAPKHSVADVTYHAPVDEKFSPF